MIGVDPGSVKIVTRNIRLTRAEEKKAAEAAINAAGAILLHNVRQFGAIKDGHDAAFFRSKDNPYARRHGTIQYRHMQHRAWWVHFQTGAMLRALKGKPSSGGLGFMVFADPGVAPHVKYVIQGTRVMLPRDVIWRTATFKPVRVEMMRSIVRVLGKQLRTQADVRFR